MIQGRDFIVFSDDWGRHPFSCQHIMEYFLQDNRLLWVQTIGLRTPRLTWYDLRRSLEKLRSWMQPKKARARRPLPPNLRILSPIMIPFNAIGPVRSFNKRGVIHAVRSVMAAWNLQAPVLLTTLPNAADYVGALDESLVVYYCVDDFALWPGMNQPKLVRRMERDLLRQADLVAVTSEALLTTRAGGKSAPRMLSHGVDMAHFSRNDLRCPSELGCLTGPIVGGYGLIDQRVDLDLILRILRDRPQWTVVYIGNAVVSLDALHKYPRFLHIPAVPYSLLPAYAARFDVAILPYVVTKQTESINPLKLREYLATGKPVVSSPLPEATALSPAVRVAADASGFLAAIDEALADSTDPAQRRAALAGHSWADKAELLSSWIQEALRTKANDGGGG